MITNKQEVICYPPSAEERALIEQLKESLGLTTDQEVIRVVILLATGHATRPTKES